MSKDNDQQETLKAGEALSEEKLRMLEKMSETAQESKDGDFEQTIQNFGGDPADLITMGAASKRKESHSSDRTTESQDLQVEDGDLFSVTPEPQGRYLLKGESEADAEIGRGGLGRVLLTFDRHMAREIAIKELLPDTDAEPNGDWQQGNAPALIGPGVSHFLQEAKITGQLEHPSIVPVYEIGRRSDGTYYYAMKLVRGRTLADALDECDEYLTRIKLLDHFADLCQAIAYAHSKHVIHRDIKPSNVMVGEFGETVVLDWGLAKFIEGAESREKGTRPEEGSDSDMQGDIVGTPAYMSPEQTRGGFDRIDERSDVWSLGVLLYKMLTGKLPFAGNSMLEVMDRIREQPLTPILEICPEAPADLAAVAEKALEKNSENRYSNAKELADEISAFQTGARIGAYEYTSFELLKRFAIKNKALSAMTLISIVMLIIGTVVIFQAYRNAERARDAAEKARAEAVFNQSKAHRNFALSLDEKVAKEMKEKAFLSARVFAAQSLLNNPFNPYSPYRFRDKNLLNTNKAAVERAMSHAPLFQAKAEGLVSYSGSLKGHKDLVSSAAFSPDGHWIASSSKDLTIGIWKAEDRSLVASLTGHRKLVRKVAFSPDGKLLASVSSDQTLKFWEAPDWKCVATLTGHEDIIPTLAFSPKGRLVATAGFDGTVRIWDVPKRRLLRTLRGHEDRVWSVTFSPDGRTLASAGKDGSIRLWSMTSFQQVKVLSGHEDQVLSVSFSPDGKWLASTGWDKMILVWKLPEFELRATLRGHKDRVIASAFSSDSKILATSSFDSEIKLWTTDDLELAETIKGHDNSVWSLTFSPDGKTLASSSSDKIVKLWSVGKRGMSRVLKGHQERVYATAVSPDGKILASSSWDQSVRLWSMGSGELLGELKGHNGKLTAVEFSPSGDTVASASSDKTIRLWSVEKRKVKTVLKGHTDEVWSIAYSPDGKLLASAGKDKSIRLWNISNGSEIAKLEGNEDMVYLVSFSPDGLTLASVSADKTLRLWSVSERRQLEIATDHEDNVSGLAFSPDGRTLASSGKDGKIKLRSLPSLKPQMTIPAHEEWVNSVVFSPDGRLLLSGSDDNSARIWNAKTGDLLQVVHLSDGVTGPTFSRDGLSFIVDDMNNIIIYPLGLSIWRRPPDEIIWEVEGESGLRLDGLVLKPID